jgi:MFS family permease
MSSWRQRFQTCACSSLLRRHRRTRAVAGTGLLFAACWLIVLGAGKTTVTIASYGGFVAAAAVFGLGETLLAPSLPAIVNDLAAEDTRGRYVAVYSLSWQAGPMVGPTIAGAALAAGNGCSASRSPVPWPRRPRSRSSVSSHPARTGRSAVEMG